MSYAKGDLRHRIRLALAQTYDIVGRSYDILGKTYHVATPYDIVGPTSYVTSHVGRRMYDVAYAIVGPTYDVVGQDVRHRRRPKTSHVAKIQPEMNFKLRAGSHLES
jgi:hypothetical protein